MMRSHIVFKYGCHMQIGWVWDLGVGLTLEAFCQYPAARDELCTIIMGYITACDMDICCLFFADR